MMQDNHDRHWHFDIDIVGGCNLRCPSCPVGNSDYGAVPKGYMKPDMLDAILTKAKAECRSLDISLYNWTEPFLHPRLAEMIGIVKSHGLTCTISTNLNIIKKLEDVLAAGPDVIRVSASGFWQERYGVTHAKGDIEVVKKNMRTLSLLKDKMGAKTALTVLFHRYKDNAEDEVAFRQFAGDYGYKFTAVWAYLMPLEKVLEVAEPGSTGNIVTQSDQTLIDRLALPTDKALEVARGADYAGCGLRDVQVAITVEGNAMLCCSTYDLQKNKIGPYLDMTLDALQAARNAHALCTTCTKHGAHALGAYHPADKLDEIAFKTVEEAGRGPTHPRLRKGSFMTSLDRFRRRTRRKVLQLTGQL